MKPDVKKDLDAIIAALTLEEKASLCSGRDFWTTKAVERLGILSWMMTDGPHGLRKQSADPSQLGLLASIPATCFPSGSGLASTWNPELVEDVGRALGREARAEGVGVVLGPGANIKRSPLCGRNFEYFSEDPFLAGELAKGHIRGLQAEGVGASLKHFAANNQETARMLVDAVVDERTLREIYLPAFEAAVKEARPWTVMCSYNKLNGTYASEHPWLLTTLLRDEWGYEGAVVTDWGACNERVAGLAAGQDLEMPGYGGISDAEIVAAVKAGGLDEAALDRAVRRNLELTFKVLDAQAAAGAHGATGATGAAGAAGAALHDAHHALARRVAAESMVLLKNEGGILPLKGRGKIAFIGAFAREPRYQGGGSSHINPARMDDAVDEARVAVSFAAGYAPRGLEPDPALLAEARAVAAAADVAMLFVGVPDVLESEGFDRRDMSLPRSHEALIADVLSVQKNVVVVLSNGAPVEMPWIDRVGAVLESYLGGQAWGGAVADILFGKVSPSGRLAETFPKRLEDNPSFLNFPGELRRVEYREGIFVGYRYYDAAKVEPLFPFGHGLSYSKFEYSNLRLDRSAMRDSETLRLSVDVRNSGVVAAQETVQIYVGAVAPKLPRPPRELKAFRKVALAPGETRTLEFGLGKRAFAHWSVAHHDWVVDSGDYAVAAAASSRDLRLQATLRVESTAPDLHDWDMNATLGELAENPAAEARAKQFLGAATGMFGGFEPDSPEARMMEALVRELPLRSLARLGGGAVPITEIEGLLAMARRKA